LKECGDPNVGIGRKYQCTARSGVSVTYECEAVDGWARPKDTCSTDTRTVVDCPDRTTCTEETRICSFSTVGGPCLASADCATNLACSLYNNTCQPKKIFGASCETQDECMNGLFCNRNNTCAFHFSVGADQLCKPNIPNECEYGFYCPNVENATCIRPQSPICTQDSDCAQYGTTCVCARDGTKRCSPALVVPSSCAQFYADSVVCLNNYGCSDFSDDPASCAMKNCPALMQCALNCIYDGVQTQMTPFTCTRYPTFACDIRTATNDETLLTGTPLPTLPKPPSDAMTLSVMSWLLTLLLVALMNL
jgi:hypothetical protein